MNVVLFVFGSLHVEFQMLLRVLSLLFLPQLSTGAPVKGDKQGEKCSSSVI